MAINNEKKYFTLSEVIKLLERFENQKFWGEITLFWQDGKVILWKEVMTKKP